MGRVEMKKLPPLLESWLNRQSYRSVFLSLKPWVLLARATPGLSLTSKLIGCFDAGSSALAGV